MDIDQAIVIVQKLADEVVEAYGVEAYGVVSIKASIALRDAAG